MKNEKIFLRYYTVIKNIEHSSTFQWSSEKIDKIDTPMKDCRKEEIFVQSLFVFVKFFSPLTN
jgi:hypothetical protein